MNTIQVLPTVRSVDPGFSGDAMARFQALVACCIEQSFQDMQIECLQEIVVAPVGQVESVANALLRASSHNLGESPRVRTSATAVAIPIPREGSLYCSIVVDQHELLARDIVKCCGSARHQRRVSKEWA